MPCDALLLEEMIEAVDQVVALVPEVSVAELAADWMRGDALLWNFAVLGEAATPLSDVQPARLHGRRSA